MEFLYRLFNRRPDPAPATKTGPTPAGAPAPVPGGAPPVSPSPVGAFITKESPITFPGATAAITLVWGFVNRFTTPTGRTADLIGLVICGLVGLFLYVINITDPTAPPSAREKAIGFVIAIFNTIVLFMASFGAQAAIKAGSGS